MQNSQPLFPPLTPPPPETLNTENKLLSQLYMGSSYRTKFHSGEGKPNIYSHNIVYVDVLKAKGAPEMFCFSPIEK